MNQRTIDRHRFDVVHGRLDAGVVRRHERPDRIAIDPEARPAPCQRHRIAADATAEIEHRLGSESRRLPRCHRAAGRLFDATSIEQQSRRVLELRHPPAAGSSEFERLGDRTVGMIPTESRHRGRRHARRLDLRGGGEQRTRRRIRKRPPGVETVIDHPRILPVPGPSISRPRGTSDDTDVLQRR